jgi:ribosomal protein S18 acetylase RimI-like enzyme
LGLEAAILVFACWLDLNQGVPHQPAHKTEVRPRRQLLPARRLTAEGLAGDLTLAVRMKPIRNSPAIGVRPEEAQDEAFLCEVFASKREAELAGLGWDESQRKAFLKMQFQAMRQGYRAMFPRAEFLIVLNEQTRIGRWVIDRGEEAWRVVDLALLPEWRGRGIGTGLLRGLLEQAQEEKVCVRLQVLTGSPAVRLYERLGFGRCSEESPYLPREWSPELRKKQPAD